MYVLLGVWYGVGYGVGCVVVCEVYGVWCMVYCMLFGVWSLHKVFVILHFEFTGTYSETSYLESYPLPSAPRPSPICVLYVRCGMVWCCMCAVVWYGKTPYTLHLTLYTLHLTYTMNHVASFTRIY